MPDHRLIALVYRTGRVADAQVCGAGAISAYSAHAQQGAGQGREAGAAVAVPDRAEATASELGQVTVQQGPIKSGSIQLGMWATMRVKIVLAGPKSLATKEILCASGGGGSQLRTRLQPPNSLLAGKLN